jgi:hypothetical protein
MMSSDQRSAEWYRRMAAALEDPAAFQNLAATLQRSATNQDAALAGIGTDDPGEAKRFMRVADALLRGASIQADMMQMNRQVMMDQMEITKQQGQTTRDTVDRFKLGMQNALAEAESGYRITKWMYVTLFVLGIALVVTAVISGFIGQDAKWSTIIGLIGGAGTVAALLFGQQKALESSRADLMQLQIAVFSWLDNLVRLNTGVTMIVQSGAVTPALLQEVWQQSHRATAEVLELVQIYCEGRAPTKKTSSKD